MPRPPKKFNPHPFAYHQEIELTIDTLTNLGLGLGRVDDWVVMIPFALPAERVRVRVYRNHKNYSEADLVEVLEPSPHRVEPVCPLFGTCGGCQYQNFEYGQQLLWKQGQVRELLQRLAGVEGAEVDPVIASPKLYGYRSKITPHFQKPREGKIGSIGFLHTGRRFEIIDVEHCPIASEPINQQLLATREAVRTGAADFKKGATLLLRDCDGGQVLTDSKAICHERVGDLEFRFPAGDFFQNNPAILPAFVDYVRSEAEAAGARFLVDAYCGSGLFALACARSFEAVAGVEVSEGSITWARENAKLNRIENAKFHLGSAESIFAETGHFPPAETAVVIDPPRKGCSTEFLDQLFAFGPGAIVYVSCNPATQMRDLVRFHESGYELLRVQPFDLFPQTRHLECVMTLRRGLSSPNLRS